jgi:ribosomal protein S18 acetylase RimI-like enzyme
MPATRSSATRYQRGVKLLIRDVRPVEYDAVSDLLADTYGGEGLVGAAYLPAVHDTAARAKEPGTDVLVAVSSQTETSAPATARRVLGTATLALPGARHNSGSTSGEATLRMLAVHRTARKRGIGTALVAECVARARLAGASSLGLDTSDMMSDAHRLYARLGFRRVPERDAPARSGGILRAYQVELQPWPTIRPARPEEHRAAGELTVEAYVDAGLIGAGDAYAAHLEDAERRAAEAELLVAVDATHHLLGTVTYCPTGSAYGEIARSDEGEFRMLAVARHARRSGIGEALVRSCLRLGRAEGKTGLALSTATAMRSAHRLYERLGFTREPARDWTPVPGVDLIAYAREI